MACVCTDRYNECLFDYHKPRRMINYIWESCCYADHKIILPRGSIKKLIGYDLTWYDEPVILKEDDNI
jgi:hypothetical protein